MADDNLVQELYKSILKEYEANVKNSASIQRFLFSLKEGEALSEDVSKYASDIGECAAEALDKYLVPEYLPNKKITWELLSETVDPLMQIVFASVVDAASIVTRLEDKAQGIHLKPIAPEYPYERVQALMNSMLRRYEPEDGKQSI